ncbi:hypothetical protein ANN_19881 [Periplaneta americana]|uniref:Uncharacterized protein n=1 Tax=Periplaneta americana TaxID=6978 RepID=A0ABQ8SBN9_PERAM|nr:hypothetical protein ANN_19881 [Periplaneta americana]
MKLVMRDDIWRGFAIDYLAFTLKLGKTSEKSQPGNQPKRGSNPRPSANSDRSHYPNFSMYGKTHACEHSVHDDHRKPEHTLRPGLDRKGIDCAVFRFVVKSCVNCEMFVIDCNNCKWLKYNNLNNNMGQGDVCGTVNIVRKRGQIYPSSEKSRKGELLRIDRHNKIRSTTANELRRTDKYEVYEETGCLPADGSNRRADIIIIDQKKLCTHSRSHSPF